MVMLICICICTLSKDNTGRIPDIIRIEKRLLEIARAEDKKKCGVGGNGLPGMVPHVQKKKRKRSVSIDITHHHQQQQQQHCVCYVCEKR